MAKKNNHHYVLVFSGDGPVYVTKIGDGKTAYWNRDEKPHELSEAWAESISIGLTINGNHAVHVVSNYEIDYQPYNYDEYEIRFEEKCSNTNDYLY